MASPAIRRQVMMELSGPESCKKKGPETRLPLTKTSTSTSTSTGMYRATAVEAAEGWGVASDTVGAPNTTSSRAKGDGMFPKEAGPGVINARATW